MEISKKSDKRILIGNISLMLLIIIITTAYWHFYSWYSETAAYGTLIGAVFLTVTLFCYVDIKEMLHDKWFILMAVADCVAFINLFLVGSSFGAVLTVFDLLLAIYMSDKITLLKWQKLVICVYTAFFFYYWTIDVKGYFKGYNTNYGGLVLITGFIFAMYSLEYLRRVILINKPKPLTGICFAFEIFMFAWGYNIIAWYRSRCALLGLCVFLVLMLLPERWFYNSIVYRLLVYGTTVGSVVFTLLYVWLGSMKDTFTLRIFYKDIISGREEIWSELWGAYIQKPITGIGSSYEMKLDWLNGLFEVHNGILDILIVHGVFVFAVAIVLIITHFLHPYKSQNKGALNKTAMAGVFAMMLPAFMENYIIVPPFTYLLVVLLNMAGENPMKKMNENKRRNLL